MPNILAEPISIANISRLYEKLCQRRHNHHHTYQFYSDLHKGEWKSFPIKSNQTEMLPYHWAALTRTHTLYIGWSNCSEENGNILCAYYTCSSHIPMIYIDLKAKHSATEHAHKSIICWSCRMHSINIQRWRKLCTAAKTTAAIQNSE